MKHKVILACLENIASAVIVNDTTIYHEDNDKGYHNDGFKAQLVATRIARVLGTNVQEVTITIEQVGEDWDFDIINEVAIQEAE